MTCFGDVNGDSDINACMGFAANSLGVSLPNLGTFNNSIVFCMVWTFGWDGCVEMGLAACWNLYSSTAHGGRGGGGGGGGGVGAGTTSTLEAQSPPPSCQSLLPDL